MAGSIASATSTRVDSASKHILPCKVNTDYMASLVGDNVDNSMRELQTNKMRYCMHKDDLVIGLGRPMYGSSIINNRKKAYPSVIVTLASMEPESRKWIAIHNFLVKDSDSSSSYKRKYLEILNGKSKDSDSNDLKKASGKIGSLPKDKVGRIQCQIDNMLEFYFVGVSLGTAYAHPHSGDTVASVMIGGLRTVLNGGFQVHTNDLLMFYWGDDEAQLFETNGGRKDRKVLSLENGDVSYEKIANWVKEGILEGSSKNPMSKTEENRKIYHQRGNGTYPNGPGGRHQGKQNVAMIKPYIVSRYMDENTGAPQHFPMDKFRIFGKAISNAQPYEMLDIMLSRQAI